jgi:hypothetical protein
MTNEDAFLWSGFSKHDCQRCYWLHTEDNGYSWCKKKLDPSDCNRFKEGHKEVRHA